MRQGLIQVGVGGWGATWVEKGLASTNWELVGCVDANPDALIEVQRVHGYPADRCFPTVADAARETGATGALVVVPPHLHLPVALDAYAAGLHVLVEKPLADTMANGQMMVTQAAAGGRTLMVSQNYRYKAAGKRRPSCSHVPGRSARPRRRGDGPPARPAARIGGALIGREAEERRGRAVLAGARCDDPCPGDRSPPPVLRGGRRRAVNPSPTQSAANGSRGTWRATGSRRILSRTTFRGLQTRPRTAHPSVACDASAGLRLSPSS